MKFKVRSSKFDVGLSVFVIAMLVSSVRAQNPPQQSPPQPQPSAAQPPVVTSQEALLLAQGWGYLSSGDIAHAAGVSAQILTQFPLSEAGLALGVETELRQTGWAGALDLYERWLGARHVDDPYALRRIARAVLHDAIRNVETRTAALQALIADGDADAVAQANTASKAGRFGDTQALATTGDERAIRALIAQLDAYPDARGPVIEALAASKSKLAVPALVKLLDDPREQTQAQAANALGRIGDPSVTEKLRPLLEASRAYPVRFMAAQALGQLGDASGVAFLRNALDAAAAYPNASLVQVQAAEALANIGPDTGWIDSARGLLNDPDPNVRAHAAKIIAPYDNAVAKATLTALGNDPNPAIRQEAAQFLAERVAGDFATLRLLLRSSDAAARASAAARILEISR